MYQNISKDKDEHAVTSNEIQWFPSLEEYDPGISKEQWLNLLYNDEIIGSDLIWARTLAICYIENDNAIPAVLNEKYGYKKGALKAYCTNIAKKVHELSGCPVYEGKEYWAILFQSEDPDDGKNPQCRRKLRPEFEDALLERNILKYLEKEDIRIHFEQKDNNSEAINPQNVIIDTSFDFITDAGGKDPDSHSKTLRKYHQALWSKELPCGEKMLLSTRRDYLTWKGFFFASDSIIVDFRRYIRYSRMIEKIKTEVPDWYNELERTFDHRTYTIGGTTIFPKHNNSINQMKGMNKKISDRWDLTLECIRRYYKGEDSPLYRYLLYDKSFFDLFVDFKGYVDFFFFQDCVSEDYSKVIFWYGNGDFNENPLPQSVEDYQIWIRRQLDFLDKRNKRIDDFLHQS